MNKNLSLYCLSILAACAVIGCGKKDPPTPTATTAPSIESTGRFGSGGAPTQAVANLVGEWEGKPELDKSKPEQQMAEQMLKLMGNVPLDLKEGGKFELKMLGIPMEGTYSLQGETLTLKPEKALGMTVEELQKMPDAKNMKSKMDPMALQVTDGGKTLVLKDPKEGGTQLVFRRGVPKAAVKKTVAKLEEPYVGEYGARMAPEEIQKLKAEERPMAEAAMGAMGLDLKEDNTFDASMIFDMKGTWKVVKGKVILYPETVMGVKAETTKDFVLTPAGAVLIPYEAGKKLPFTFFKK